MSVELRNSPNLPEPQSFSHAAIAGPGRIVHLAGQGAADATGNVAGDLAAQTEKALLNLAEALTAAGGTLADLVKVTIYVVGWNESMIEDLLAGVAAAEAGRPWPAVPATLVGVRSLFLDSMLVEVEGVAVLPIDEKD